MARSFSPDAGSSKNRKNVRSIGMIVNSQDGSNMDNIYAAILSWFYLLRDRPFHPAWKQLFYVRINKGWHQMQWGKERTGFSIFGLDNTTRIIKKND